jgi:hypothetical protein
MRTKEMNHVVTETSPGELGVGCSCGKRFPTRNAAELHASDQNLIEKNEAKAKKSDKAEAHAAELAKQPKEPTEPEKEPEDESDSNTGPSARREAAAAGGPAVSDFHLVGDAPSSQPFQPAARS